MRPRQPAELSPVVDLKEWQVDNVSIGSETTVHLVAGSNVPCSGGFQTDPKAWFNVSRSLKRPDPTPQGYTKPFLHIVCRFVHAEGDAVKIAAERTLNHSRSDRGECRFQGPVRVPAIPGEYELQLLAGVEPPEAPFWGGLPYEWHVLARCNADVAPPK